ncbi:hypothetical protein LTR60_003445, partial [Cryomyces antarcticus]
LNGDYNPLHATPEPGRAMGFGGAIMHGLFSWNSTCHGLLHELGNSDPANIKEFQARFASPVKPGDKLVTQMWRTGEVDAEGWEEVRFVTSVEGGKVCLSNGRALMKCGGGKSKLMRGLQQRSHVPVVLLIPLFRQDMDLFSDPRFLLGESPVVQCRNNGNESSTSRFLVRWTYCRESIGHLHSPTRCLRDLDTTCYHTSWAKAFPRILEFKADYNAEALRGPGRASTPPTPRFRSAWNQHSLPPVILSSLP